MRAEEEPFSVFSLSETLSHVCPSDEIGNEVTGVGSMRLF